jgi:hypothetical protein
MLTDASPPLFSPPLSYSPPAKSTRDRGEWFLAGQLPAKSSLAAVRSASVNVLEVVLRSFNLDT